VRVLFDTNVVLDVLLDRQPFSSMAAQLFARVERGQLAGCLGATTVTTLFYLAVKVNGVGSAREQIRHLLELFEVAPVDRTVLEAALSSAFSDFEDGVLHEAGSQYGIDGIVTRNGADFAHAQVPIFSPAELETLLASRPS
jgi:predicted nucleic acid-binding protein